VALQATGRAATGAKRKVDAVKNVLPGTCPMPCLSELLAVKPGGTSSLTETTSFFLGTKSHQFFKDHVAVFKAAYEEQSLEFAAAADKAAELASAERNASPVPTPAPKRRRGAGK
jgi:hypothetical protein